MPRKPDWNQRLEYVTAALREVPAAYLLDRKAIQSLFNTSSRQATRIMNMLGAMSLGGALVIRAADLTETLALLEKDGAVAFEQRRRSRLEDQLNAARWESRSRRIEIPQPAVPQGSTPGITSLPEQIQLSPGQLHIRFSHPTELLQQLLLLARAISEDWTAFEGALTVR